MPKPESNAVVGALSSIAEQLNRNFMNWETLVAFILLLAGCLLVIRILMAMARRAITRTNLDKTAHRFLLSGLHAILWIFACCILLHYLGVSLTSLVAVLGVVGIALSLAIQGVLSNLAGGIMLLTSHPFSAGDWVEVGSVSGVITDVGLVYTKLSTLDNKIIFIPNGDISSKTIVNYTNAEKRLVELKFSVSYDAPAEVVKSCMARAAGEHPKTLPTPAPMIRTCRFGDSSIEYLLRVWCATEDYWPVYYDLMEQVKDAFDQAGVELTYNHLNVHIKQD